MKDRLQALHEELSQFEDPRRQCFLCGGHLSVKGQTDEHVIPQWAQRRYELWNQSLTLLNGTPLPYRRLAVPCCDDCNKYRLAPIEDSLSQVVDAGRNSVLALGSKTLFLWLGKIFYGILYREMMLLRDRSDPNSGTIITEEFLNQYRTHRFFLQQARGLVELKDFEPGSLFVFDAQALPDRRLEWDLADNINSLFIGVRVGKVAMFGVLGDGGAQQFEEEIYRDYYCLPLHPIQIRELCAQFSYRSMCATRVPKYITMDSSPHMTWQMPLGGFSSKPLFSEWDPDTYALILTHYLGYPLDFIYPETGRVMTWLRDDNGAVRYMSFKDHPVMPPKHLVDGAA